MSVERDPPPDARAAWLARPAAGPVRVPGTAPATAERAAFASALQQAERRRGDDAGARSSSRPGGGASAREGDRGPAPTRAESGRGLAGRETRDGPARQGARAPARDGGGGAAVRAGGREAPRDARTEGSGLRGGGRIGEGSADADELAREADLSPFAALAESGAGAWRESATVPTPPPAGIGHASADGGGALSGPVDGDALAQLMTRLRSDAQAGGRWRFDVLGDAGEIASLQLRHSDGGGWQVRVTLRDDGDGGGGSDTFGDELEAALRAAGHRVDALAVVHRTDADD